jgi:hypothetical protein
MKEKGYEALRSNLADYYWPDVVSKYERTQGKLKYRNVKKDYTILDSYDVMMDVVKRVFVDRGTLPSVYHGIVARTALDRVYKMTQTFFPGQSPDISNGIATALVTKEFLYIDDIITISGASKFHGGATIGNFKRYPQISDMVWFRPDAEKIWDRRLPRIAVGPIIWAESSIETFRNMGHNDIIDKIDFESLYRHFVVYHYPVRKLAFPLSKHPFFLAFFSKIVMIKRVWNAGMRMLKSRLKIKDANYNELYDLSNIQEAIAALNH